MAFLVKDNLPCKHLLLSVEEALVNFLQDDSSSEGIIELEPMGSYNRLLLHRLADIFGFAHESIGEGDDRHLILERCPETSIPPVLVNDILWQYDGSQSPTTSHQLLRKNETTLELKTKSSCFQYSIEEREAAYMAARQRIFSLGEGERSEPTKQKPRNVPEVARRMIAHALGKKLDPSSQVALHGDAKVGMGQTVVSDNGEKDMLDSLKLDDEKSTDVGISGKGAGSATRRDNLKAAHMGAAKRIFAHALGQRATRDILTSKCNEARGAEVGVKNVNRE